MCDTCVIRHRHLITVDRLLEEERDKFGRKINEGHCPGGARIAVSYLRAAHPKAMVEAI